MAKTDKTKLKNESKGLKSNLADNFKSILVTSDDSNALGPNTPPKRKRDKVVKFDPSFISPNTAALGTSKPTVVSPSPTKKKRKKQTSPAGKNKPASEDDDPINRNLKAWTLELQKKRGSLLNDGNTTKPAASVRHNLK